MLRALADPASLKAISVNRDPAAGTSDGLQFAAHARCRFARARTDHRAIRDGLVAQIRLLDIGSLVREHRGVLLMQFDEGIQRIHTRLLGT